MPEEAGWYNAWICDPKMESGYSEELRRVFFNGRAWEGLPDGYTVYSWKEIT
ncbi:hypothetical protein [Bremerella sp. P1]|uniref:hypothetical protein n=1 Tax=Bremerella sp. P1 TaxID=3026424 RepID=UPI002367904F|nr:hypothetical protein [Bremerella sp. P1]WDI44789.1 hypothetical protein PSR63_12670 [Bremerella sp. P1]